MSDHGVEKWKLPGGKTQVFCLCGWHSTLTAMSDAIDQYDNHLPTEEEE